jgi:glutathione S-transferase
MPSDRLLLYVDDRFLSPYAMSVFVALHEKGLPFEIAALDLGAKQTREAGFLATSLTGRVPTLLHGEFALSESSAITEYLDEAFPDTRLYPEDRRDRARARQLQGWLRTDLLPLRVERSTEVLFYSPSKEALSEAAQASARHLFAVAQALLAEQSENLFGAWSIADLDLATMLNRLVINGDPVPDSLADYARHQWQRPSVQLWVNQPRRLLGD